MCMLQRCAHLPPFAAGARDRRVPRGLPRAREAGALRAHSWCGQAASDWRGLASAARWRHPAEAGSRPRTDRHDDLEGPHPARMVCTPTGAPPHLGSVVDLRRRAGRLAGLASPVLDDPLGRRGRRPRRLPHRGALWLCCGARREQQQQWRRRRCPPCSVRARAKPRAETGVAEAAATAGSRLVQWSRGPSSVPLFDEFSFSLGLSFSPWDPI